VLVDAGGGLCQQVDVVTCLRHVEEEEDRDGAESEHSQPDDRQDVRRDDELADEERLIDKEDDHESFEFSVSFPCGHLGSKH